MNIINENERNASGEPILLPEEDLKRTFNCIRIDMDHMDSIPDKGTLYVTTLRALWIPDEKSNKGYAWTFHSILLHAISRDTQSFPSPCLYCQLSEEEPSEVRFIPAEETQLPELFDAFSHSAMLNPDEEVEDDNEWIYDQDQVDLDDEQAQMLDRFDAMLQVSPNMNRMQDTPVVEGQFDDAEEDDDDELL